MDNEREMSGQSNPKGSALVIGGGVGGIKAAIDLAESGAHVYLLEETPFIGGTISQLDRQFPTNDCGMCKMLPSFGNELCSDICLRRSLVHPNVDIITNAALKNLEGEPGKFKALVTKKARYVDAKKCTACDKCVVVCPIEVEDPFNQKLTKRKAIYIRYPSAVPTVYAIDNKNCNRCGECVKTCPTDAVNLELEDEEEELNVGAIILALGFEPFDPSEAGAYHYSEFKNVLTALEFERLISGTGPNLDRNLQRVSDGQIPTSIAFVQCVGSRDETNNYCSYTCCMHSIKEAMMARELYPEMSISIFFMDMRAFGKGYHRYYEEAKRIGINFIRSRVADLWEDGDQNLTINYADESDMPKSTTFEMVVLATGQNPPRKAKELGRILGIELDRHGFCTTKKGSPIETSRDGVFVCGSFSGPKDIPDTITEASACAAHAGELLVKVSDEEQKEADEVEVKRDKGQEQNENIGIFVCKCGGDIDSSLADELVEFSKSLSDVSLAESIDFLCVDLGDVMKRIADAKVGKVIFAACAPYPFETKFKKALISVGIDPGLLEIVNLREGCCWVHEDKEKPADKAKALLAMANEKLRGQEPLFKGSSPVIQKALVIGGGIAGMTAALNIAKSRHLIDIVEKSDTLGGNARYVHYTIDGLDVQKLLSSIIKEVNGNDLITVHMDSEVLSVSGRVGGFIAEIRSSSESKKVEYGAVIIATGAEELVPREYLYGAHEAMITQRDLEKRLVEGNFKAKNILMIQCVGLRDEERRYCGRICCLQALKNALKIKETHPEKEVHILYSDMMTYGFSEEYYIRAKELGVDFIRYELEGKPEVAMKGDKLEVKVKDIVLDEYLMLGPDLVVLSVGPSPENNIAVKEIFETHLELDEDGFFSEADIKFRPVDFISEGIYVCGLAHSPRNLYESMAQAQATAGRTLTILAKKELLSKEYISEVNERWCVGCEACITACPFDARIMEGDRKIAKVIEALCQGCGVCAVVCPSSAAKLKGFKDKQIMAMIDEAVA